MDDRLARDLDNSIGDLVVAIDITRANLTQEQEDAIEEYDEARQDFEEKYRAVMYAFGRVPKY